MRQLLTTIGEVAGMAVASVGLAMAWLPLGVTAAGLSLFAVSYLVGR